ncbi:MAG: tape measure protein [Candidatus Onthovivens sp.]|nr:tape measure protein [Candidatus Onthovivens sp.]
MENAPLLAEAIAKYTGKSKGELKELSSDGLITSDIIKNAMFASADQINARYSKMPMTWGQIWTRMKNVAIKALDPVLVKINQLANNEQVQQMFYMFINGASLAAQAVLGLIEGISWLMSVLEPLAPVIFGIVGAYVAFNIISGITSGVLSIMSLIQGIQAAASMMQAGATLSATAAQWGLNTALLACPITWIVILIIALIAVLTYLWFTNDKVAYAILYVWDALRLGIMVAGLGIQAIWYGLVLAIMYLWLGVQTCILGMMGAWYGFQTGIEAVCLGVLSIFQGLYNGIVSIVNRNNKSIK